MAKERSCRCVVLGVCVLLCVVCVCVKKENGKIGPFAYFFCTFPLYLFVVSELCLSLANSLSAASTLSPHPASVSEFENSDPFLIGIPVVNDI